MLVIIDGQEIEATVTDYKIWNDGDSEPMDSEQLLMTESDNKRELAKSIVLRKIRSEQEIELRTFRVKVLEKEFIVSCEVKINPAIQKVQISVV
jgi:hypothetical protein